jgi:hypothetical protein
MVRDYSERRQQRINPPPKRPAVWPYVLLILVMLLLAFLAGMATGWYLYRPGGRFYKAPATAPPPVSQKKGTVLPPQGEPIAPAAAPQSSQQPVQNPLPGQPPYEKGSGAPPLTFYNTLQKGNKGLMGTGINQPKEGQQTAPAKPAAAQSPER